MVWRSYVSLMRAHESVHISVSVLVHVTACVSASMYCLYMCMRLTLCRVLIVFVQKSKYYKLTLYTSVILSNSCLRATRHCLIICA
jgi:hypothetical protein